MTPEKVSTLVLLPLRQRRKTNQLFKQAALVVAVESSAQAEYLTVFSL